MAETGVFAAIDRCEAPAPAAPLKPVQERAEPGRALGWIGRLEVRLAAGDDDIAAAQGLRYRVFHEEGSAIPDALARATHRDADRFDAFCEHLLVVDHDDGAAPVVATCRLLGQDRATAAGGFYSGSEFDVASLVARHPKTRFLELGRSCVSPPYRNKRTMELLWHGIWSYVLGTGVDVMIGCASLEGIDPDRLALPLSFLRHVARAPEFWRAPALPGMAVSMDRMRPEEIDRRAALAALPPLLKGYLRLGAKVGDDAVVDCQFGTTDVLIILPVAAISERYVAHYGADARRYAACTRGPRH